MTRRLRTSALALGAAISLAALAAPALAQKYYDDEIIITPPVYSNGVDRPNSAPGDRVSAQVIVSTRDLNLRNSADVSILQQRISDGARLACEQADEAIRNDGGNPGFDQRDQCYRDARLGALREARLMVDYARG